MSVAPSDILGGPTSTLGTFQPSAQAPLVFPVGYVQQIPMLEVLVNDTTPIQNALRATIVVDYDARVATATIECADEVGELGSNGSGYYDTISITCGAGFNNALRFRGIYLEQTKSVWPFRWIVQARGKLYLAQRFQQPIGYPSLASVAPVPGILGLGLVDLVGSDPTQWTDQNIVLAALNRVQPTIDVDPADIGGTGRLFGQLAFTETIWRTYADALSYVDLYDRICLGYRLFESLGGRVRRAQIFGYPSGTVDAAFTEGEDIWAGSEGGRGVSTLINAAAINGYTIASQGASYQIRWAPDTDPLAQESNPFQPATEIHVDPIDSPLIELQDQDTSGLPAALSAQEVGVWKRIEGNRELVEHTLITHRDDLIAPARTISVNSPHSGVTESIWVRGVTIVVQSEGDAKWKQTIRGRGGGIPGADGTPNYAPLPVY